MSVPYSSTNKVGFPQAPQNPFQSVQESRQFASGPGLNPAYHQPPGPDFSPLPSSPPFSNGVPSATGTKYPFYAPAQTRGTHPGPASNHSFPTPAPASAFSAPSMNPRSSIPAPNAFPTPPAPVSSAFNNQFNHPSSNPQQQTFAATTPGRGDDSQLNAFRPYGTAPVSGPKTFPSPMALPKPSSGFHHTSAALPVSGPPTSTVVTYQHAHSPHHAPTDPQIQMHNVPESTWRASTATTLSANTITGPSSFHQFAGSDVRQSVAQTQQAPRYLAENYPSCVAQLSSGGHQNQQRNIVNQMGQGFQNMNIASGYQQQGDVVDVMSEKHIITTGFDDIDYRLPQALANSEAKVDSSVFRCTLNAIPQNEDILKKSRLPFGLTLQPFRDIKNLNVIQTSTIVRCRYCRTYINPYVTLPDHRHWKCNLCGRNNDLPDDFSWDPVAKTFGDPCNRPEIKQATVEFVAPSEYMPVRKNKEGRNELRPPQPALYAFIMDVSAPAIESGYLYAFSEQLLINLDRLPGEDRTQVCFIAVDSSLHFFQFHSGARLPTELVIDDVDEPFLPTNSGILVNLLKNKEAIRSFVQRLPEIFDKPTSSGNAVGAALNVVHEMIADVGGRISVFQCSLPNMGPGKLESREDPNGRGGAPDPTHLGPATDFYKRLALECTGHQVGIDLFTLNSQYVDLATLSEMAKFSSGCVYHFPNYHLLNEMTQVKRFEKILARYLTRKIGFEAVLRIRCSKGLGVSNFYGNFFMRSTDLLSLANVNPDSAIAVQVNYEEKLNTSVACFQAALLYTSSKGERRIRVHTMCLPIVSDLGTIYASFDLKAAISLITKMGVDRCMLGSTPLNDAREATINAVVDALGAYGKSVGSTRPGLSAPRAGHLRLFPLFAHALLKHQAFAASWSVRLDDRLAAMLTFRFSPLEQLLSEIYPNLYCLTDIPKMPDGEFPRPLPLSFEHVSRHGVYLLETGTYLYIYVPQDAEPNFVQQVFGLPYLQLSEHSWREQNSEVWHRVNAFVKNIQHLKFFLSPPIVVREDSVLRETVVRRLVEDRTDSSFSYFEFLKHVHQEVKGV